MRSPSVPNHALIPPRAPIVIDPRMEIGPDKRKIKNLLTWHLSNLFKITSNTSSGRTAKVYRRVGCKYSSGLKLSPHSPHPCIAIGPYQPARTRTCRCRIAQSTRSSPLRLHYICRVTSGFDPTNWVRRPGRLNHGPQNASPDMIWR